MAIYKQFVRNTLFCLLLFPAILSAQINSTARSLSLAGAYTTVARGVAAPFWNPANLALPDRPPVTFQLLGAGFRVGNLSLSKSMYDEYNGKYLTSADIETILSEIPDDGFKFIIDADVQALGFTIGSFALTFSSNVSSNLSISKDYFRVILEGLNVNTNYNIGNNSGEAIAYSTITASYAFPIALPLLNKTYLGINLNYLLGLGYGKVLESYGNLYHRGWEVEGNGRIRARYAQGGAGFGIDVGIATIKKGWHLGLFLKNIGSKINWTSETEEFEANFFTVRGITVENASDEDSLDIFLFDEDETREIGNFSTSLPSEFRLGASRKWRSFLLAMDYHQGFSSRPGISKIPYLAFSTEWQGLGILPLRLGFGFGGEHGALLATGFGFKCGFLRLDYGISFNGGLSPSKASTIGMALSTYLSF